MAHRTVVKKVAAAAGLPVMIRKGDGDPVPANSILSVLTLNVACGDTVTLDVWQERR